MPFRLGRRFWTSAMFASDSTKSSGTISPRLRMNATTAYTSFGLNVLGAFQGMARLT